MATRSASLLATAALWLVALALAAAPDAVIAQECEDPGELATAAPSP
jgi:hypothetical protein